MDIAKNVRGIRLDVYIEDDNNTVYDIEMQIANKGNVSKRSRYYQSCMDMEMLKPGDSFNKLKKSYVIFICSYDPFGLNHRKYEFQNVCVEPKKYRTELGDETKKIFLYTKGLTRNVSDEVYGALDYIETSINNNNQLRLARMMEQQFKKTIDDPEWRKEVMNLRQRLIEEHVEGREEERKELLIKLLKNLPIEEVSKMTDISIDEINNIIK